MQTITIKPFFFSLLPVVVFLSVFAHAGDSLLSGRVVKVADGDTITVLQDNTQYKIRLYGIDCPENGQDFGNVAKKLTSSLTFDKVVDVVVYDTDRYGRSVGVVFVNKTNVNEQILSGGLAWVYRKYCKASFCDDWTDLEREAKVSRVGLWSHNDSVPPWTYRKNKRSRGK